MPRRRDFAAELKTVRRTLLPLAGVTEREHFGGPAFCANGRMFVLFWAREGRWIMKLPHYQQMMLFDSRPETFAPMRSGQMTWSYVNLANLDSDELTELLQRAWRSATLRKQAGTRLARDLAKEKRS
jgi:hypothetical protein